jgi:uncharacterized protein (TIGR02001 family)
MPEAAYGERSSVIGSTGMALHRVLRHIAAAAIAYFASQAQAQVSATASVVSDYRFRGISLSDGHAEPQLQLGYDHPRGWYTGAFASGTDLRNESSTALQVVAYGGYARRHAASGTGWDVGITHSLWPSAARYNYLEAYAALTAENASIKLSYSPTYFGSDAATLYVEANGGVPVRQWLQLQWHAGYLHPMTDIAYSSQYVQRGVDLLLGIAAVMDAWSMQIAWTGKRRHSDTYEPGGSPLSHGWIFSARATF